MNFDTKNLIILHYPPYAGGKFISNCLALSKYAVPQHVAAAQIELSKFDPTPRYEIMKGCDWPSYYDFLHDNWNNVPIEIKEEIENDTQLRSHKNTFNLYSNLEYYEWKKKIALLSLPPSKDKMPSWLSYEYGCYELFGITIDVWGQSVAIKNNIPFYEISRQLSRGNHKFFIVAHLNSIAHNMQQFFPNSTVLSLTNFNKFQSISVKLKGCTKEFDPADVEIFDLKNNIVYDIDTNIFDEEKFIPSLKELYNKFGFDDFHSVEQNLREFYRAYAALHF